MKKTVLFVALVVALVLSFATSAFAIGPFLHTDYKNTEFTAAAGDGAPLGVTGNYLDWDLAQTMAGNSGTSPHGGYSSSTNKCAVCHSVHQARPGRTVLTAYGPYTSYAAGCVACHGTGSTFTDVQMTANADGYISPHGTCTRCHTINPHGAGGSIYPVLSAKLLNTTGDAFITADMGANGYVAADFAGTGNTAMALTLGTGYLCSGCHAQSFAVNVAGIDPNGGGAYTGHKVFVTAAADYTNAGTALGNDLGMDPAAFKNAQGCDSCHDAQDVNSDTAFPHGYVDAAGAVTPKTLATSSYVWLTVADDALGTNAALLTKAPYTPGNDLDADPTVGTENAELLSNDGLCIKCHRADAAANVSGVGLSF